MRTRMAWALAAGFLVIGASALTLQASAGSRHSTRAFVVVLTSGQLVPPKTNIFHGVGFLTLDESTRTLTYSIPAVDGNTRTAVRVRGPAAPGEEADVLFDLAPGSFSQPIQGTADLTRQQVGIVRRGLAYIEVETQTNPDGEVRGQIVPAVTYR